MLYTESGGSLPCMSQKAQGEEAAQKGTQEEDFKDPTSGDILPHQKQRRKREPTGVKYPEEKALL